MVKKKLPIGIQSFREIRENNYLYVDKTALIYQLFSGKYYFLSRPRRFGKSLLLSTIKEIFSGSQDLFKNLWIYDKWDWTVKHPVIHLKISKIDYQRLGLYEALNLEMLNQSIEQGITLKTETLKRRFDELITQVSKRGKVVLLIDEYDKPIIDYLGNKAKVDEHRAVMKEFYSILKDADPYLRFVLITGVSKFSRVSIFSDLNNLNDLTIHPHYTTLLGVTQSELEHYFSEDIEILSETNPSVTEDIKSWYNGYSWDGTSKVYNPFSLLRFMESYSFQNFWFETGTPTFLIEQVKKRKQFNFDEVKTGYSGLSDFDVDNLNPITLLFQTGYLTIQEYNPKFQLYTLTYPNEEVRGSLLQYLVGAYRYDNAAETTPLIVHLHDAFFDNNIEEVIAVINTAFATIPYDLWRDATELHCHALVHLTFSLLGTYIQSEVHSSKGRCDALVHTPQYVYALEFKLDKSAEVALAQIKEKGYLKPYAASGKRLMAVGVNFSSEKKAVEGYLMEDMGH